MDLEEPSKKPDRSQEQSGSLEKIVEERDQLQEQVRGLEDTARERDRLQQQNRHLQDLANERDRLQEDLVSITEERDSFRDRAVELQRQLQDVSGLDEGKQAKEPEPGSEMDEDPKRSSQPEAPKKLRYCNVCLKSVDKLSANV